MRFRDLRFQREKQGFAEALFHQVIKDYKKPEDLIGENGIPREDERT